MRNEDRTDQPRYNWPDDAIGLGVLRLLLKGSKRHPFRAPMLNAQRAFFLAAMILSAASVVPSQARAHGGHVHAVPAAETGHVMAQHASKQPAVAGRTSAKLAKADLRNRGVPPTGGCADHCCGGANGMSCCGSALLPQFCFVPFLEAYSRFVIRDLPAPTGIPPDALPKPPKSFA